MTYHFGEKWAKRCSLLKEAYDLELCTEAAQLSDACFASLPSSVQTKIAGTCCSAFQSSDFKDNATGRGCAYKVGWKLSCPPLFYYYSCAACCTDKGAGPDVPEEKNAVDTQSIVVEGSRHSKHRGVM